MQEIGTMLKNERQEKGISLEEISEKTKIQIRFLNSLENGDFTCFAGRVYLLGALRGYAEYVGINPTELIAYYEGLVRRDSADQIIDNKKGNRQEIRSENKGDYKPDKKIEYNDGMFQYKERRPIPFLGLVWVVLLVVVFGGSLWYRFLGPNSEEGRHRGGPEQDVALNEDPVDPETAFFVVEEETQTPIGSPQILLQSSGAREAVYLLSGVDDMELILHFTAKCWVEITRDGIVLEEKIYERGEKRELPAGSSETKIRLGAPRGAWLEVNGLELNDWREVTNPINIIIKKT
jgi:cytoskeletal protein RodZ